jgi:FtsP/CotA-like multicopper oxidase with cupredoxin domain
MLHNGSIVQQRHIPAQSGLPDAERAVQPDTVSRRQFLHGAALSGMALLTPQPFARRQARVAPAQSAGPQGRPDFHLEISEIEWELAPKKLVRTAAYGGQIPGRLLRVTEGKPVTVSITNRLDHEEIVHWHGQWIPSDVDGSAEEGTPMIAPDATTQVTFTPRPRGLHWYHTHVKAYRDLKLGLYSGQFGVLLVEGRENPAPYDQEQFVVLHDWDPYFVSSDDGSEMVNYRLGSVNGRMLGHGEPIRVNEGQRVLFHILNASATEPHWIALAGHRFKLMALDGRPVPTHAEADVLRLGPAERVSAIVSMNAPGVWVLGEAQESFRSAGMGCVVEYGNRRGKPAMQKVALKWDYGVFGDEETVTHTPDVTIPLVFTSKFEGHGALDRWMINGKSFPHTDPVRLKEGLRHRLIFDNRSTDNHPVHLHRHAFELVRVAGAPTSGVRKDVVIVEARTQVEVDLVANNPGPTLFHCHQQDHMDSGFMTMFLYA